MITGAHTMLYTQDAVALRAFFRDVLELPCVDAGDGWLIFGLPPAELAAHPAAAPDGGELSLVSGAGKSAGRHELYLLCDDIEATVHELTAKGVEFAGAVTDQGWGLLTSIQLPGGGELGLYEPRHRRPGTA